MVVRMALPPWASCLRVATKCMAVVLSSPALISTGLTHCFNIYTCITATITIGATATTVLLFVMLVILKASDRLWFKTGAAAGSQCGYVWELGKGLPGVGGCLRGSMGRFRRAHT